MSVSPIIAATSLSQPWADAEHPTNPGVGNDFSEAYKANLLSELRYLEIQLTCDANAANRYLTVTIATLAQSNIIAVSTAYVVASQYKIMHFAVGISAYTDPGGTHIYMPLPANIRFTDESTLEIDIISKQAGDQLTGIETIWNRWPNFTG